MVTTRTLKIQLIACLNKPSAGPSLAMDKKDSIAIRKLEELLFEAKGFEVKEKPIGPAEFTTLAIHVSTIINTHPNLVPPETRRIVRQQVDSILVSLGVNILASLNSLIQLNVIENMLPSVRCNYLFQHRQRLLSALTPYPDFAKQFILACGAHDYAVIQSFASNNNRLARNFLTERNINDLRGEGEAKHYSPAASGVIRIGTPAAGFSMAPPPLARREHKPHSVIVIDALAAAFEQKGSPPPSAPSVVPGVEDISATQIFAEKKIEADFLQDFRCPVSMQIVRGNAFRIKKANGSAQYGSDALVRWVREERKNPVDNSPVGPDDIKMVTAEYRGAVQAATENYLYGCGIVTMAEAPRNAASVKTLANASYVRVVGRGTLFYINKAQNKCIEIKLPDSTQQSRLISTIDGELKPTSNPVVLSESKLARISSLINASEGIPYHVPLPYEQVQTVIQQLWRCLNWPVPVIERKAAPASAPAPVERAAPLSDHRERKSQPLLSQPFYKSKGFWLKAILGLIIGIGTGLIGAYFISGVAPGWLLIATGAGGSLIGSIFGAKAATEEYRPASSRRDHVPGAAPSHPDPSSLARVPFPLGQHVSRAAVALPSAARPEGAASPGPARPEGAAPPARAAVGHDAKHTPGHR